MGSTDRIIAIPDNSKRQTRWVLWIFTVGLIFVAGYNQWRVFPRKPEDTQVDEEVDKHFWKNKDSVDDAILPQLDAMRNLPLFRAFAKKRYKYVWSVGFCWFALLFPGIIINAWEGTLLSSLVASELAGKLPVSLNIINNILYYVSRSSVNVAFLEDTGILLLLVPNQ